MKFFGLSTTLCSLATIVSGIAVPQPEPLFRASSSQSLYNGQALQQLAAQGAVNLAAYSLSHPSSNGCNIGNAAIRTELYVDQIYVRTPAYNIYSRRMPKYMRKQFTDAVMCLYTKPSNLNGNTSYPGVKNRYDDYPAAHIEFDRFHHFSATFLHWHRYAIWTFERDLRTKCGYTGYLPYWDWGLDAAAPQDAEIFNGDQYSMGSNGAYIPNPNPIVFLVPLPNSFLSTLANPQTNITVPAYTGTGGGCINANGPFGQAQAHLGPTILSAYGPPTGLTNAFQYNPRCLKRDLNPYITQRYTTYKNITEVITNFTDIGTFQAVLQSDSRYAETIGNIGVHAGGHVGAGGEPMADQPSTPGDPLWFLHHAQIDRMWSIWQAQDLKNRLMTVSATGTNLNYPPSPNVTLDDIVDMNYLNDGGSPPRTVRDLGSTTLSGPFCYIYV